MRTLLAGARLAVFACACLLLPACAAEAAGGGGQDRAPLAEPTSPTSPGAAGAAVEDRAATSAAEPSTAAPGTSAPAGVAAPPAADPAPVELERTAVASDLAAPWGLAFAGERVFVTERDSGRVLELVDGRTTEVTTLEVDNEGEGGLLGIAPSPTFAQDQLLYAYLTTTADNRVVRLPADGGPAEPVLTGIPAGRVHNGGRLAFGADGLLYIGTGDSGSAELAQDLGSLAGKVLRVTPDGEVPAGNPFEGSAVWTYGHRNVQGLAWGPSGTLYATEFGPDRDDEVNILQPGGNYGWPEVTGRVDDPRFIDPVVVRQPAEASWSGAVVLTGGAIPQWEGDLFSAALRGGRLWRFPLADDGAVLADQAESLLVGEGRLRLVAQAPDGSLWVMTNNTDGRGSPQPGDDRILRIGPPAP